jgi:predicted transcriptional regulator
MTMELEITPELQARIDAIAARSNLSASEVIADALENGHSLEWQEHFLDKVAAGIEAADRGEFASRADIERVRNKYRPS